MGFSFIGRSRSLPAPRWRWTGGDGRSGRWIYGLVLLAMLACLPPAWSGESSAGQMVTVRGEVRLYRGDAEFEAERGFEVLVGDRIVTGRRGFIVVELGDRSRFHLGADADMVVTAFRFEGRGEQDSVSVDVAKGVFRFLSGQVAEDRVEAMKVGVGRLGTIGVRGTHVGGEVSQSSAKIVLLRPPEQKATAIEVSNEYGSVYIDEPGWGTLIPDEHSPPSTPRRMRLRAVENMMRAIQGMGRMPGRIR